MASYKNGNYVVTILKDGTKIRRTEDDEFIPSFAENCDCKLTDRCSQGCKFCYEGCTKEGKHGDLFSYKFLDSLHPFTELAMNGNDLDHPDMEKFLEFLKSKKVFGNLTVNQNQFLSNYSKLKDWQERGLVHGIGVSLVKATPELIEKLQDLPNIVLHTINGILKEEDIEALKGKGLKVLILGYKDLQRGHTYKAENSSSLKKNQEYLYNYLPEMTKEFSVVSFDNLAITQLDVKRIVPEGEWDEFYMGDDGGYTFYIDMVKGEFAKNSLSQERYPIGDLSIDEMFNKIKNK